MAASSVNSIDIRPNGDMCLDDMVPYQPDKTQKIYQDPLTGVWSVDVDRLAQSMFVLGIPSLDLSRKIVNGMKNFKHWEGEWLSLDDGTIVKDGSSYKYKQPSLHFVSNQSMKRIQTCMISYYRHINIGTYMEGQPAQPNLSKDTENGILSYINRTKNYMFKSSMIPEALIPYFALDDEATYSISDSMRAVEISDFLLKFLDRDSVVVDMTACVGGNTIAFSKNFFVRAQEIDALRYTLLRYNCELAGLPQNKYLCWCVDSIKVLNQVDNITIDGIYCDPPWGGPAYVNLPSIDLTLGGMPLHEIAYKSLQQQKAKVFVCRTTHNYNMEPFIERMRGFKTYEYVTYKSNDRSRALFNLLIVTRFDYMPRNWRAPSKFGHFEFKRIYY